MPTEFFVYDYDQPIQDSGLRLRAIADPDDAAIETFDCGTSEPAVSINDYIRSGSWFARRNHIGIAFAVPEGDVAGIAVVRTRVQPHPTPDASSSEPYLVLLAFGVNRPYQGREDSGSPDAHRISDSMVRAILGVTDANGLAGAYLWVRKSNGGAMALYARNGFMTDAGIPHIDEFGTEFLGMRHLNPAAYALHVGT